MDSFFGASLDMIATGRSTIKGLRGDYMKKDKKTMDEEEGGGGRCVLTEDFKGSGKGLKEDKIQRRAKLGLRPELARWKKKWQPEAEMRQVRHDAILGYQNFRGNPRTRRTKNIPCGIENAAASIFRYRVAQFEVLGLWYMPLLSFTGVPRVSWLLWPQM